MSKLFGLFSISALAAALLGGAVTHIPAHAAGILFVKPAATGSGDCSSWTNACSLQTALASAVGGDQIWVKAGMYKPTGPNGDRMVSFVLKNGVEVYGGFLGTETDLSQRNSDPATNATVLSGDLNGNDNGFTNNGENSYHVVNSNNRNSTAILDGFTIRGGNANGSPPSDSGGGVINGNGSRATLKNVTLSGNFASSNGGGMFNLDSNPILINVSFSGNSAYLDGGGMFSNTNGNPTLTNVIFSGNSASGGGGMYNNGGSATLTNVTFAGNVAPGGGGMFNGYNTPTLTNVTFSGNSAQFGGGMYNQSSNLTLTNVTFSGNAASSKGGGMANFNSSPTLTNTTFTGNSAPSGSGMHSDNKSTPILINTIIANSPSGGDCVNDSSTFSAAGANNLIEDASNACGLTNGVNGNIIGADPNLGPLANNGGPTKTHALLAGSPAIDAGNDMNCAATDQRGLIRPEGNHCDIGSYEFAFSTRTITGNAGAAGVSFSYVDGTPKTVTSQPNGTYFLPVLAGWSGMVTPSHPCFTFSPASRQYMNVLANQIGQNYTATFNSAAGCASINVKIGDTSVGTNGIPAQGSLRVSYDGINNGPVTVTSLNGIPIIVAERVAFLFGNTATSFSELMGLPQNLVSNKYSFPAYDNANFNSQLRFGNVSASTVTVRLSIGGHEMTSGCVPDQPISYPYSLGPGASLRVSCPGVNGGPVAIQSTGNMIAALRVVPLIYNGSYSEVMGVPQGQVSRTYYFPWYNNVSLNTQLRIGDVSGSPNTVHVYIHGQEVISGCTPKNSPFTLSANQSIRISCPGVNNGPVKIVGTGNTVASERVGYFDGNNAGIRFSELMGLPAGQLAITYFFPWYNDASLDTQLRFGNVSDTQQATVHVYIGGQEMTGGCTVNGQVSNSPYALPGGASLRVSCPGVNNGPVKIVSTGNIVASERVAINNGSAGINFSELMGLPQSQLTTSYVFPWYNNLSLNTQLRFGVP